MEEDARLDADARDALKEVLNRDPTPTPESMTRWWEAKRRHYNAAPDAESSTRRFYVASELGDGMGIGLDGLG